MAHRVDHCATAMANTLQAHKVDFRERKNRSVTQCAQLPKSVTPGDFEKELDPRRPVAVWNGGIHSSAEKLDQMIEWLHGDADAI